MNKTFLFSLLVMMCGAMLVCCSGHNEVNLNEDPQDATVELPPSPCVMYMVSATTILQYINFINNKPIGRIKYALV